jgi:CheY-like chemotaxis protein
MESPVLIVEDDFALRTLFSHTLKILNCQPDFVSDGREAIDYLNHHTPALIFLDMRLPFVNGEVVLEYIHRQKRFAFTRVVCISATQSYGALPMVNEFLLKPIIPRHILQITRDTLGATI